MAADILSQDEAENLSTLNPFPAEWYGKPSKKRIIEVFSKYALRKETIEDIANELNLSRFRIEHYLYRAQLQLGWKPTPPTTEELVQSFDLSELYAQVVDLENCDTIIRLMVDRIKLEHTYKEY